MNYKVVSGMKHMKFKIVKTKIIVKSHIYLLMFTCRSNGFQKPHSMILC